MLIWMYCVVCGEIKGKFDYFFKYGGVICERYWLMDDYCYYVDFWVVYFVWMFLVIFYDKISGIYLKEEIK